MGSTMHKEPDDAMESIQINVAKAIKAGVHGLSDRCQLEHRYA